MCALDAAQGSLSPHRVRAVGAGLAALALGTMVLWGDKVQAQLQELHQAFTQASGQTLTIPVQTTGTTPAVVLRFFGGGAYQPGSFQPAHRKHHGARIEHLLSVGCSFPAPGDPSTARHTVRCGHHVGRWQRLLGGCRPTVR